MAHTPQRLRASVEDGGDRLDARRAVLTTLLSELAFKAKLTVSTSIEWADLKCVVEERGLKAAVARYIDAKITPLGQLEAHMYRENAQLGAAVTAAVQLASELDHWAAGMAALAQKQSSIPGSALISQLKYMVNSDLAEFMSASGTFEPVHVHGLGAVLWIRSGIYEVDLSDCILPSAETAVLIKMLPLRITKLHLADTDFCMRGKDLRPLEALCSYLASADCGLRDVDLARNSLGNLACEMITTALAHNTSLTSLVRATRASNPRARARAHAARHHST